MKTKAIPSVLLILCVCLVGCPRPGGTPPKVTKNDVPETPSRPLTETEKKILAVTQSEQLIQSMATKLKLLAKAFRETDFDSSQFAESALDYKGIASADIEALLVTALQETDDLAAYFYWPLDESEQTVSLADVWKPITGKYRFEDSQIGVLKGSFPKSLDEFEMETKFEGRIRTEDDRKIGVKGKQTLVWREIEPKNWKLVSWKQTELKLITSKKSLFHNVTREVFPDQALFDKISSSSHEEMIVKRSGETNVNLSIKSAREEYKAFSDWESTGQYPSISVVDFDLDGDDDLFLTDRWQSPQLLRNKGDGTFEDATAESGLTFDEFVNCGYFFDYDNDGDADLLVGYSVKPSRFFTNDHGKFTPHEKINEVLDQARVVVAISAADVNRDGLLDLYLCTYSSATGPFQDWIEHVTRPEDRVMTRMKIERADKFVDRGGPPNILLMNRGDTFEWSKMDDDLKQYRSSYQSSWMDFDSDGDLDLYVCNDFSPDVFLRNDTPQGSFDPKFVNVTGEIAPTVQMGFGMGTSYGDFDNDADLDLYVCNMYSKAGNRIIAQLDNVDERLAVSARGNFLYENTGGTFRQIAGDGPDQQHVNVVGWSFGGQFADFDNDGHLDLYVPSGFYSAPEEVNTDLDL